MDKELNLDLNEQRFLLLLEQLIGETEKLQNNPPHLIPQEDLAANHVLKVLGPYSVENGGPLKIERISYKPGRSNLIITYPGTMNDKVVSFVGSHMDVVPAQPSEWTRYPFKLIVEGDKLYGRGTTDCLGHVALLTDLFAQLAEKRPSLKTTVTAVFIADEESGKDPDVGVDHLCRDGKLNSLKSGPLYWVDSADLHPLVGSGTMIPWKLTFFGKRGHSGLPHNAINPILIAIEALRYILYQFHRDFPTHPLESKYGYEVSTTMKPTQWSLPDVSSINQIPEIVTVSGDIRMVPFYKVEDAMAAVEKYVKWLNENITFLQTSHNAFKNELPDGTRGMVKLEWLGTPYRGVACNMESVSYKILYEATKEVLGTVKPFAETGALPLVADLQECGFDLQIIGFGVSEAYHANNEYCTLSGMKKGFAICTKIIEKFNAL